MRIENWRCIAIGILAGSCFHLLLGIIRVARSAAFKRDHKMLRDQKRLERRAKRDS